jgi:hypothetical protein
MNENSFVFVSHAAIDKKTFVRPIVCALAMEEVPLWVDRPGYGESHFDFDQRFIETHQIRSLHAGQSWDLQIADAVRQSSAVLGCLSAALFEDRKVLNQELLIAWHSKKLVTCIVDSTFEIADLPSDIGLLNFERIQSERIDVRALSEAVEWLACHPKEKADDLPSNLKLPWEQIRKIKADLNSIRLRRFESEKTRSTVPLFPINEDVVRFVMNFQIAPAVMPDNISFEVISAVSELFEDPFSASALFEKSMELAKKVHDPKLFSVNQIVVRKAELPSPLRATAEEYWSALLISAGLKSRRTLAVIVFLAAESSFCKSRPDLQILLATYLDQLR